MKRSDRLKHKEVIKCSSCNKAHIFVPNSIERKCECGDTVRR